MEIDVNETLVKEAQKMFDEMGLDIETAINIFLKQCVKEQRIPFDIGNIPVEIPNAETIAAMKEVEEMAKSGKPPRFNTVEEMFKALEIEC